MYGDIDDLAAFTTQERNIVPLVLDRSQITGI